MTIDNVSPPQGSLQVSDPPVRTPTFFDMHRPGRNRNAPPQDLDPLRAFGDDVYHKDAQFTRLFFQNVKGLTYSTSGEDFKYVLDSLKSSVQADVVGLSETNLPWIQAVHLQDDFRQCLRRQFLVGKTVFSSPSIDIDPIDITDKFQAGGTLTFTVGSLVPMLANSNAIQDPTGLGRWSGMTFRGKDDTNLSIITLYRVCRGSITTAPIGSSFNREFNYFRDRQEHSLNPRTHVLRSLQKLILQLSQQQHSVVIMMDANSTLHDDRELRDFLEHCDLHDLHAQDPAPSTYLGSPNRRIDFIFGSSDILRCLKQSGTLSYNDGPQSDHRGLYVDIDLHALLGYSLSPSAFPSPASRLLKAGNPELVATYVTKIKEYYDDHDMFTRIDRLYETYTTMSREAVRSLLEGWDSDQGRAMSGAEKALKKPPQKYQWSPELRNAGILRQYWKLRLFDAVQSTDHTARMLRLEVQVQQNDSTFRLPHLRENLPIETVRRNLNKATKNLRKIQRASSDYRMRNLYELLAVYDSYGASISPTESRKRAAIVRRTIQTEICRGVYGNIRQQTRPIERSGIQHVNIPRESLRLQTSSYQYLQSNPTDVIWEKIVDRTAIEHQILQYNRESFRAAAVSPCGHGIIHDELTFTSISPAALDLLKGHIPPDWQADEPHLRAFLSSFTIPDSVQDAPTISTVLHSDDISRGFRLWKETTTTSPSGRHLGHYKALITDEKLLQSLTKFLQITLNLGISLSRWHHAVNVMLEKDPGVPNVNRLRIIHLFEADYNLILKIMWGSRLVRRALALDLLHPCQHGSVPRHTTMDAIMLTQLTTDLCRVNKQNLARFDNDASACYDRIIVNLAMLAARRCGMPLNAIQTHAEALQFMQYTVKTVYGVSAESYQGTPFAPLFGTGQGSGASPAAWLSLVVLLMNTLDRLIPERMEFSTPTHQHTRLMDAFVDDTSLGFTDTGVLSCPDLIKRLADIAQTWEQLLSYSGGSLNLKKCSWYVMYWEWLEGRPILRPIQPTDPDVILTQGASLDTHSIKRTPLDASTRMLGVYLSPNGDFSDHLKSMQLKADAYASRLRSPKLTATDIRIFHRSIYTPAMKYSLPAIAVDEEVFAPIQSKIIASILNGLRVARTIPTSIRHGPVIMGGLDLLDLRTESGIAAIKLLRDSVFAQSETGKMILINLYSSQVESGLGSPLLVDPTISVSYLTPTWITSIRQFLYQHNLRIDLTDSIEPQLRTIHDKFIMDPDLLLRFLPAQRRDINLVRLYLQASTLYDLSAGTDGKTICQYSYHGTRSSTFAPKPHWPRQEPPTPSQVKLWQDYLDTHFLRYKLFWSKSLGDRIPQKPSRYSDVFDTAQPAVSYRDLRTFLRALPPFYRRLLFHHEQRATALEVFRAFRSKRRLEIVSDGSLASNIGTFGWHIIQAPSLILFEGTGPVDGIIESANSTRSELGGFAAPLLLVAAISRFWGLPHR